MPVIFKLRQPPGANRSHREVVVCVSAPLERCAGPYNLTVSTERLSNTKNKQFRHLHFVSGPHVVYVNLFNIRMMTV